MPDFWRHSGFHLMQRVRTGECEVSDDLLRAYFARPEVVPPPDAGCSVRPKSDSVNVVTWLATPSATVAS